MLALVLGMEPAVAAQIVERVPKLAESAAMEWTARVLVAPALAQSFGPPVSDEPLPLPHSTMHHPVLPPSVHLRAVHPRQFVPHIAWLYQPDFFAYPRLTAHHQAHLPLPDFQAIMRAPLAPDQELLTEVAQLTVRPVVVRLQVALLALSADWEVLE